MKGWRPWLAVGLTGGLRRAYARWKGDTSPATRVVAIRTFVAAPVIIDGKTRQPQLRKLVA